MLRNFTKWQSRSFTRQTRIKSQHDVIGNMADLVQWHSRKTVKQKKRREDTESGGETERFGRNPVCPLSNSSIFYCLVLGQSDPGNSNSVISNSKLFPLDLFFGHLFSIGYSNYFSTPLRVRQSRIQINLLQATDETSHAPRQLWNLFDKFKSGLTYILTCVLYFGVKQIYHVNRARVLVG